MEMPKFKPEGEGDPVQEKHKGFMEKVRGEVDQMLSSLGLGYLTAVVLMEIAKYVQPELKNIPTQEAMALTGAWTGASYYAMRKFWPGAKEYITN